MKMVVNGNRRDTCCIDTGESSRRDEKVGDRGI